MLIYVMAKVNYSLYKSRSQSGFVVSKLVVKYFKFINILNRGNDYELLKQIQECIL